MHGRKRNFSALSIVVILALTIMAPAATFAQEPVGGFTATSLEANSTLAAVKTDVAGAETTLVPVIVKLEGDSLAAYKGGVAGLKATSPAVTGASRLDLDSKASVAYLGHLAAAQNAFAAEALAAVPGAQITHQFDLILNGVAMIVPADAIDTLASLPGVEAVYPDELLHLTTSNSPQFIGAPTAWAMAGGQEKAGENVIVGVLDTGIWPEHPSLSDPDPLGHAYPPPPPPPSGTRNCDFSGGSNPGPAFTCNNKLIGAQYFLQTYELVNGLLPDEYTSARDDNGHGTHTATTAAGNGGVAASIFGVPRGIVSGIAPRARVMAYRVCASAGCFGSDSAAAVQEAIRDGVNVINFSISGGANPYSDVVEQAFLDAYEAGIFVAASAGNSGPTPETTDHRGPWVTTVAASTQDRSFDTTATLTGAGGATLQETGASITAGIGPNEVVVAPDPLCLGPYVPGQFTGKIVVCRRGSIGRAEKGYNVLQGGAVGMILYNNAPNVTDLETDNHWLPAVHIQYAQGVAVLDFLTANPGATAAWAAGAAQPAQGDVMASFSSRGGPAQSLGVSKPDITAPGVQILAGHTPAHLDPPEGVAEGPQGELFQAIAGTSMSSPHIAGSGAMIKSIHPDWTPGQIKSALMTTAWTQVLKEDGATPTNPFDDGSGRVDLNVAGDPGLTFDVTAAQYRAHEKDLWNANYPSVYIPVMPGMMTVLRTAQSVLPAASTWNLSVMGATDFRVSVPPSITVPAGRNRQFPIKIDASNVPLGEWRTATVYLTQVGGDRQLHIPVTFVRKLGKVTLDKTCAPGVIRRGEVTTCTITAANLSTSDANVSIIDRLPAQLRLVPGSVVGGVETSGSKLKTIEWSGLLAGAQPPNIMVGPGLTPAGYLPLSLFGIAPIAGVGDETVTNFNVPSFLYGGEVYTRIGIGSNGYAVVGGSTGSQDVQFINQDLPDPARPNNVIAPFWTDLNPAAGGALRVATLGDGSDTWLVLEWAAVKEYSTAATASFQIWIGINTDAHPGEDVSIAYGPIGGNGDGGYLTVGAENRLGDRGQNVYFDGTGTLPAEGTELVVTSTPGAAGGIHTLTFQAKGFALGVWVNQANMIGDIFPGTATAQFRGEVVR